MKLIFVFIDSTNAPYGAQEEASLSNLLQNQRCGNWLRVQISSHQELWIHGEYKPAESEWDCLKTALNNTTVTEIYVAFHATWIQNNPGARQPIVDELKKIWPNIGLFSNDFSRLEGDRIWRSFSELILALPQLANNLGALFEELARRIKKELTPEQRLGILKHRLSYLFLPIDIDAQGLIEVGNRAQYWGGENPYTDKILKDLWKQARKLANDIKQVIDEIEAKVSDTEKEKICQVCGKMAFLDNDEPPKEVTQIFQDLEQTEPVGLEELKCHWTQFHNWLVDLCEAMDELRDAVEKVEGGR
jgi:hypothetical protein